MARRIDRTWIVLASPENPEGNRCVDVFRRPDGTFGFEEFRRDPEDAGAWTPVRFFSAQSFVSTAAARAAARAAVPWLAAVDVGSH